MIVLTFPGKLSHHGTDFLWEQGKLNWRTVHTFEFQQLRYNGNTCLHIATHLEEVMQVKIDKIVGSIVSNVNYAKIDMQMSKIFRINDIF